MADEPKPPVAIRITRPYATEAEFLEREFDTITHTSVALLGAQTRPQGVVLRFEIVLKGGESVLRGEGRVIGYKENAHGGEPGLTLRFTRLDSRSKSFVDRAAALREARARGSQSMVPAAPPPAPKPAPEPKPEPPAVEARPEKPEKSAPEPKRPATPRPARGGPPPLPEAAARPVVLPEPEPPPSAASIDVEVTQVDANFDRSPPAPPPPPPDPPPAARSRPARPAPPTKPRPAAKAPPPPAPAETKHASSEEGGRSGSMERPRDRDAILTRLRSRAQLLPAARVQEILTKRAP